MPVHDRLRPAGRAGREENEERVVECDRQELERTGLGQQLRPAERVRNDVVAVRHVHDMAQRRKCGADRCNLVAAVDRPITESVAAHRKQHRRLELHETVDDAARAELRRTARPDCAEARRRREGDHRLGDVRQIGDDAVAGPDAEPLEARACTCDLVAELRKRQIERLPCLRARDHRDLVRILVGADQVLGEVQPRIREPRSPRHRVGDEDGAVRRVRLHLEELPDRRPERLEVVHRPALQLVVVGEDEAALALEPVEIAPDLGRLPDVGGRRPQNCCVIERRELRHAGANLCPMLSEMSPAVRMTAGA